MTAPRFTAAQAAVLRCFYRKSAGTFAAMSPADLHRATGLHNNGVGNVMGTLVRRGLALRQVTPYSTVYQLTEAGQQAVRDMAQPAVKIRVVPAKPVTSHSSAQIRAGRPISLPPEPWEK